MHRLQGTSVTRLLALLLLAVATPVWAIDYKIELIVFANTEPQAFHSEQWAMEVEPPAMDDALDVFGGQRRSGFMPLANGDLTEARQLLDNSERFEVLKHVVWQQPGLAADEAIPVRIHGGQDFGPQYPERMEPHLEVGEDGNIVEIPGPDRLEQLDGTVRVELGRFLHVYTDLLLRKPVVLEQVDPETQQTVQTPALLDIPMREHRRMRSRELHYIDHPLLGVLVQITPVEEETTN